MDDTQPQSRPPSGNGNLREQIDAFLSTLKTLYSQQGQLGKILLPGFLLLTLCCLCPLSLRLIIAGARSSPAITPSPIFTGIGTEATPTALFSFDATLFPTLAPPSPLPTTPSPATATSLPTPIVPTPTIPPPTATSLPTSTNTNLPPASPTSPGEELVRIITVDKRAEYVEIQNTGNAPVDLQDWRLVSETGNQPCTLYGTLQPKEVLVVWSRKGEPGLSCRYPINIWNDDRDDPAVLYDPQGKEVSRFP